MRVTKEIVEAIAFPEDSYAYHADKVIEAGVNVVRGIANKSPQEIWGLLYLLHIKLAVKKPQQDLYFRDLEEGDINLDDPTVRFEAALCIFIRLFFDHSEDIVAITRSSKDGGFDIVCLSADGETLLMLDAKSGKNYNDNHVEWNHLSAKNKVLCRIINHGSDDLGKKANEAKRNKFVYSLALKRFVKNTIHQATRDCRSISEVRKFESTMTSILNAI